MVSHGWYLLAPFRWARQEQTLHRPQILGGKAVGLAISFDGSSLLVAGAGGAVSDELRRGLGRMFQLGIDTSEFIELARSSPAHAWAASPGFGRLLCGATLFEDVVKIIATTNTWKYLAYWSEHWESVSAGLEPPEAKGE